MERYPEDGVLFQLLGEIYLYGMESPKAEGYLKQAIYYGTSAEDKECVRGSWYLLGRYYHLLGNQKEAKNAFESYLNACRDETGSLKRYEEFFGEKFRRKFRIGCAFWFLGEKEKAEEYFMAVQEGKYRCDGCDKQTCYEGMAALAMQFLEKGRWQMALELYERVKNLVPNDMEHRFEYKQMKKLEEQL